MYCVVRMFFSCYVLFKVLYRFWYVFFFIHSILTYSCIHVLLILFLVSYRFFFVLCSALPGLVMNGELAFNLIILIIWFIQCSVTVMFVIQLLHVSVGRHIVMLQSMLRFGSLKGIWGHWNFGLVNYEEAPPSILCPGSLTYSLLLMSCCS